MLESPDRHESAAIHERGVRRCRSVGVDVEKGDFRDAEPFRRGDEGCRLEVEPGDRLISRRGPPPQVFEFARVNGFRVASR